MSQPPLPFSGLIGDLPELAALQDPTDPNRLANFVQAVAAPADTPAPQPEVSVHLVAFELEGELYAVPVERVREIVRVQGLTRIPHAPEHVRGVQSLRGAILPVLETRTRLGLPPATLDPDSRIVVAEAQDRLLGLLVDRVTQVGRVPRSALQPPPPEVRGRCSDHVVGVAQLGQRIALQLDLDRLLQLPSESR